jgi:hypothetical protein
MKRAFKVNGNVQFSRPGWSEFMQDFCLLYIRRLYESPLVQSIDVLTEFELVDIDAIEKHPGLDCASVQALENSDIKLILAPFFFDDQAPENAKKKLVFHNILRPVFLELLERKSIRTSEVQRVKTGSYLVTSFKLNFQRFQIDHITVVLLLDLNIDETGQFLN